MRPLREQEFAIYALSLPRGLGFGARPPVSGWSSDDGLAFGVLRRDASDQSMGILVMRRRTDHVWTVIADEHGFPDETSAMGRLSVSLREGQPREPVPRGVRPHQPLYEVEDRDPSELFKLLAQRTHHAAAWALNQTYLALPKPDRNWVGDFQTKNFHTRMWEAQLVASFREQGVLVTQPLESPDFRIETRRGGVAWVEAVTANPAEPYEHVGAKPSRAPEDISELFFGAAAVRFAKTLGNKIDRGYHALQHVAGQPFAIALADFHAPGSMVWSRQSLVGYLYGMGARLFGPDGERVGQPIYTTTLLGPTAFPAGLFANDLHQELSAVIFSNACSLAKFNRAMISRGMDSKGLRYTRIGEFFDPAPGATKGIPFCLDVTSHEYTQLWQYGYEPWSAELEVFHNPYARHPMSRAVLPEATHWFERDGELQCERFHEVAILRSRTWIQDASKPAPRLEDFLRSDNSGSAVGEG